MNAVPSRTDRQSDRIAHASSALNVEQRLAYLREQLAPDQVKQTAPGTETKAKTSITASKLLKTAVALAVAAIIVWVPAQRACCETTSVESRGQCATRSTLRSPIDGVVSPTLVKFNLGSDIQSGDPLMQRGHQRSCRPRACR